MSNAVGESGKTTSCCINKRRQEIKFMMSIVEAILSDNVNVVSQYCHSESFDPNMVFFQRMTALHLAALKGNANICRVLLESGADPNLMVSFERLEVNEPIPEQNIIISDSEINKIFEELDNLGDVSALHISVKKEFKEICMLLCDHNVNVDLTDQGGCTPLHWAVARQNIDLVKMLLDNSAQVNHEDLVKNTPLHEAVRRGNQSIVSALLEKGADINKKDIFEQSPLQLSEDNAVLKNMLLQFSNVNPCDATKH